MTLTLSREISRDRELKTGNALVKRDVFLTVIFNGPILTLNFSACFIPCNTSFYCLSGTIHNVRTVKASQVNPCHDWKWSICGIFRSSAIPRQEGLTNTSHRSDQLTFTSYRSDHLTLKSQSSNQLNFTSHRISWLSHHIDQISCLPDNIDQISCLQHHLYQINWLPNHIHQISWLPNHINQISSFQRVPSVSICTYRGD